jgi:Zn-dependent peptidase ImmA (M78 family)
MVPELSGSRACGATRWISPEKALIQLSLRYKTADHLWFTFFHECAHLLLHGKKLVFLEGASFDGRPEEEEANRWAANFLIPLADFKRFFDEADFTPSAIRAFASQVGVHPGIVVGRLQHEKLVEHSYGNALKLRLKWKVVA